MCLMALLLGNCLPYLLQLDVAYWGDLHRKYAEVCNSPRDDKTFTTRCDMDIGVASGKLRSINENEVRTRGR